MLTDPETRTAAAILFNTFSDQSCGFLALWFGMMNGRGKSWRIYVGRCLSCWQRAMNKTLPNLGKHYKKMGTASFEHAAVISRPIFIKGTTRVCIQALSEILWCHRSFSSFAKLCLGTGTSLMALVKDKMAFAETTKMPRTSVTNSAVIGTGFIRTPSINN